MIFIGDYFALGLVLVLFLFFFDSKISVRHMSVSSKIYIAALAMTAVTAITDLFTGYLLQKQEVPLWENVLTNTMYFINALVATSLLALYMFWKILEHTHYELNNHLFQIYIQNVLHHFHLLFPPQMVLLFFLMLYTFQTKILLFVLHCLKLLH